MPKESRKRAQGHERAPQLAKRQFALQNNAGEELEIGALESLSGAEILQNMKRQDESQPVLKKKEKQQLKREAFVDKLQSAHSPYSKIQRRRFKKKQKEQVGGGLETIQAAISALDDEEPTTSDDKITANNVVDDSSHGLKKPKLKAGQIGEGKGVPLSKNQRKRALEMERLRAPMILSNPDFSTNPFTTIRKHLENTLLKHDKMPS